MKVKRPATRAHHRACRWRSQMRRRPNNRPPQPCQCTAKLICSHWLYGYSAARTTKDLFILEKATESMKLAAPLVTWQNSYALGLEEIDEQHKMLFDIMNRIWEGIVRNADATTIGSALEDLERYTVLHFTEEETFMRSIGYPQIDAHVALHRRFVQKLTDAKAKPEQGDRTSLELLHFLRDWLVNHILVEDKRYVTQFQTEKHHTSLLGRFFARLG